MSSRLISCIKKKQFPSVRMNNNDYENDGNTWLI
jgi:hypothetical protein